MTADEVIAHLDLKAHPEGGHFRETFRETFRDESGTNQRGASTAIYYLLRAGETSHWHRVDAAEVWHWYAGDVLELSVSDDGHTITRQLLGPSLTKDERPQIVVPKNVWQSARPLGRFTLAGCTVAPAFTFEGFEMAPPNWHPR